MFAALLDTCVLWPSRQRDFLLSLAIEGMYRPLWSAAILEELEYNEAEKLVGRGVESVEARHRATRLVSEMRKAFNDAEVEGWDGLDGTYGLPDPDDEHVVAAAVVGGAGAIVTLNEKDFPVRLIPRGIQIISPQEFAWNTVALNPPRAYAAVEEMSARTGKLGGKLTVSDILDILEERYCMNDAVTLLRSVNQSSGRSS